MIDWRLVVSGAFWITGLGLSLATVGMARYAAGEYGRKLCDMLTRPQFQIPINAGMIFFCLGLLIQVMSVWERLVWGGLALGFSLYTWIAWRNG